VIAGDPIKYLRSAKGAWVIDRKKAIVLVVAAFFLSRIVYLLVFAVTFDHGPLTYFLQILDPELLRNRLLESVFYLHGQPPLFNIFLGLILKIFPNHFALAFQGVFLLIGVCFSIALFLLLTRMGVRILIALILTVAFTIAPATVCYENLLFYTYPLAALLCISALFLHRFLAQASRWDGFIFFSLLAAVVLTRGIFPLAWFVVVSGTIFICAKPLRRKTIAAMLPFLLLLCLFSVKQFVLFGEFGAGSAYLGPNLAVRIAREMPADLKNRLLKEGRVSTALFTRFMKPIPEYRDLIGQIPLTGIPVLDRVMRSNGNVNSMHIGYLKLSKLKMRDVRYVLVHYPGLYLKSFSRVLMTKEGYFIPSGQNFWATRNQTSPSFLSFLRNFDLIFTGQYYYQKPGWFLVLGFPLLFAFGIVRFYSQRKTLLMNLPFQLTLGYALGNIAWLTLVTLSISTGDYNRYRFKIDSFYILLFGLLVTALLQKWRSRHAIV